MLGPASAFGPVLDRWKVLTAAALVGIADAALASASSTSWTASSSACRSARSRPCSTASPTCRSSIDGARLLTHKAAWADRRGGTGSLDWSELDVTDGSALASMAFVFASEAAAHATDRSLHYHGGYGFAEEYDIQLYYRRARGWSLVARRPDRPSASASPTVCSAPVEG